MTPPGRPTVVAYSTLTLGRRLGQGGQGTVYEVSNKRINEAVDGGGWAVAYKEYADSVRAGLDADALHAQVALLGELSAAEGRWLCDKTAWPAAVVERGGDAGGFLMRAVPERYRFTLRSLTGTPTGAKRLANLEYLLNSDDYVAGIGLTISERHRLMLLADLAATLTRLHRIGITVGDLSPKNLLFTTDPQPECFLIDCDAMRLRGATVLPQAETPDWQVPSGEEKATRTSDVYKFALLAVRLFARDQSATDPTALSSAGPGLVDLARASLNSDPARRPTPAAWAEQLTSAAATASTDPAKAAPRRKQQQARPPSPKPAQGRPPGRPSGATRPRSGGQTSRVNWDAVKGLALLGAFLVFMIVLGVTNADDDSGPSAAPVPTTTAPTDPVDSSGGYDSGGDSDETPFETPSEEPSTLTPEDEEFGEISLDDCLSNYTEDAEWTPSTPSTTSCSGGDAYFYVESVEDEYGDCSSSDRTWFHINNDDTETNLCLNRNYTADQCMFAERNGDRLSMYFNAVTPCDAGIPDEYEYIVQLTAAYPDGAPDDVCGDDRIWILDSGAVLCGDWIWKRRGLPDI
ncbi:lipopolysaccharide kinase InaA family protein [Streptomyces sp. B-S-A8]|uniref:Lipopolysaccharide kinase InaA family protein n=1 Tax=Streptomyces solicavernae TaxID=3043614 RepID=A0ABT6RM69_9ACTN|nr:lipopolysaccharide kinase InaA family protein [Streptomyces sp. B-S-A8]MDI3385533.1 lipopolysaccharide kinase InaA family protein [Streptomyces sp. B-S-A8]